MSEEARGPHRVVVAGRAERQVHPDRARWAITVEATEAEERDAFERCSARASELMTALREAAGEGAEISTASVRVSPRYDSERRRYSGYEASTTVSVASDLERAGAIAQRAIVDGVQRVSGPTFEISDPEAIKAELLEEAVDAARGKAERLAEAAQRPLGRVLLIQERGIEDASGGGYRQLAFTDAEQMREPEIVAGDQTVSVELVVAFEFAD